jgi:hypothetical protein
MNVFSLSASKWFGLSVVAICWALVGDMAASDTSQRLRIIIETDAGGDPDDEQSLVRFLLYASEWDVEGIIATRPMARERENRNSERTGLGIIQAQIRAYEQCFAKLRQHDNRFPEPELLRRLAVPGYPADGGDGEEGVRQIIAAADAPDERPIWFCNWGTDAGSAESSLKKALDRVLRERGPEGYAKFKSRFRLSSADKFGEHTTSIAPAFELWVDTFRPELDRRRWYHRFSALTAKAGGFDLERDVLTGHGPLGALYPTNTNMPQKEGDTMTFLYLLPVGLGSPEHPEWGSWGGRYGLQDDAGGRRYYWANVRDAWQGETSRDLTLARWAVALQNDFAARLDWCVNDFSAANHPPVPRVAGESVRTIRRGETVKLDASASTDPDKQPLRFEWFFYPESTGWNSLLPQWRGAGLAQAEFTAPPVQLRSELHVILAVTDTGQPPLTRYQRVLLELRP